jgi:hypothetical protein
MTSKTVPTRISAPRWRRILGRRWSRCLELAVALALLAGVYGPGVGSIEFHPDESQWIATSSALEDFVCARFDSPAWQKSYWTQTQPPVVRYVVGLGRRAGGYRPADLNPAWDWSKRREANVHAGAVPPARLLWWSRLPMVLLAIVTCGIGFHLLRQSVGRIAAYAWLGLWLLSPYFHLVLRRAMGEAPMLAGVTLVLFLCARALRGSARLAARPPWRHYLWFAGLGVGVGLAGAVKLNGLSTLLAGVGAAFVYAITGPESSWRRRLSVSSTAAAVVIVCSTVTFVGLNPYLWPRPLGRTMAMVDFRFEEIDIQKRAYPGAAPVATIKQRAKVFPDRVLNANAALKLDRIAPRVGAAMNGLPSVLLNGLLAALGLSYLAVRAWRHVRRRTHDPVSVAILIVGLSAAAPALWTPLDWSRYYLLPVYVTTMLVAVGIHRWFGLGSRLIHVGHLRKS